VAPSTVANGPPSANYCSPWTKSLNVPLTAAFVIMQMIRNQP